MPPIYSHSSHPILATPSQLTIYNKSKQIPQITLEIPPKLSTRPSCLLTLNPTQIALSFRNPQSPFRKLSPPSPTRRTAKNSTSSSAPEATPPTSSPSALKTPSSSSSG